MILEKRIKIETDLEGYLKNFAHWNESIALFIASKESLIMSDEHWTVINFLRDFYKKFNISPTVHIIVKAMFQQYGKAKGNSRYLFRLFPEGPAKQANKIAGLPKPSSCL